jgi:hypothetical protein
MRPVYETEADRIRERAVALKVKAWLAGGANAGVTAVKLKPFSPVDFAICKHDGTVVAFVEVKVRTCRSDEYDTYLLSMDKAIALRRLAQDTNGMLVYLAVEWMDRVAGGRRECGRNGREAQALLACGLRHLQARRHGGRVRRSESADMSKR